MAQITLNSTGVASNGTLALQSNGTTTAVTIDTSQNVGVGTASPTARLDIFSASASQDIYVRSPASQNASIELAGNNNTAGSTSFLLRQDTSGAALVWNRANTAMVFATNGTERMRIDTSGNLLVGATSNFGSFRGVFEKPNDSQLALNASTAGAGVYTSLYFANQGTTKTLIYWYSTDSRFYVQNGTGGVYLAQNGTTWTSASDERFKTSLVPIEDAVNKVSTLRAVTGRFLEDQENVSRAFLIAQDVQAVFPQAVDADDPEKLGVRYTDTIPLLVAAIKEQQALIQTLTDRITVLEAK